MGTSRCGAAGRHVLGREPRPGALHRRPIILLHMQGDPGWIRVDEKTRVCYKHVTIQKTRDRDHIDPRSGHGMSQAYDPVTIGELMFAYCIQNPDSREENCHAHRITNAVPNIAFSTGWFCILYGIYICYLLLRGRFRAEWICSSRAKSSCHILPESRGKRLGI